MLILTLAAVESSLVEWKCFKDVAALSNGLITNARREREADVGSSQLQKKFQRKWNERKSEEKNGSRNDRSNEIESEPGRYEYAAGSRMYH